MNCACGGKTKVIDSQKTSSADSQPMVSRRRRCVDCGERFTTYECRIENARSAKRQGPKLKVVSKQRRDVTCVSDEDALRRMREPRTTLHLAAIWDVGLPAAKRIIAKLARDGLIEEAPNDSVHSNQRMWVRKRKAS